MAVVKVASSDQREECLEVTFCSGAVTIYDDIRGKWVDELRQQEKCLVQ